jgi:hypothetical protein
MRKLAFFLILLMLTGLAAGCAQPTPTPPSAFCMAQPLPAEPRIPPVSERDHVHGSADAPFTVIEYADFQ